MPPFTVTEIVKEALEQSEVQFVLQCVSTQYLHCKPMSLQEAKDWMKGMRDYQIRVLGRVVPPHD